MAGPIVLVSEREVPAVDWRSIAIIAVTSLIGFILGDLFGFGLSSAFTGVIAGLIALVGSQGRLRFSMQWSLITGFSLVFLALIGTLTAGHIVAAAIAMAAVAFTSSWLSSSAPAGLLLSLISTLFYAFASTFAVLIADQKTSIITVLEALAVGVFCGLAAVSTRGLLSLRTVESAVSTETENAQLWQTMKASLLQFRRGPQDGIRRAIALGLAMAWFQATPGHDAIWFILTVAVILPVDGRVPIVTVGYRLFAAFLTIGVALTITFMVPEAITLVMAIASAIYAVAISARSATQATTAMFLSFLLIIGAPGADIGIYAGWRLVDTALGAALALLCGYVLWPKQKLAVVPVPIDLVLQATKLRLP